MLGSGRWSSMVEQQMAIGESARQSAMKKRLLIDREEHRHLIMHRIAETHNSLVVQNELSKFVSTAINPLRRIVDRVAVAYKVPPVRRLEGATEAQAIQWAQATKDEARIHVRAKQWGRYAMLCNTVHVLPLVISESGAKSLQYKMILPHCSSVTPSEYHEERPAILMYTLKDGAGHVAVDAEAWWEFDENFRPRSSSGRKHSLGVCPAVPFRVEEPPPGDYWHASRGSGMVDVTCDVGRVYATMEWIRKGQQRKLLVLYDPNMAMPEGQAMLPEEAVVINEDKGATELMVQDIVTSTDEFVKEMRFLIEQAAEAYGIPSSLVDLDPSTNDAANTSEQASARNQAALAEIRQNQVEVLRDSERRLAYITALTMKAERHPLALDPKFVRDAFRVEFPPLSFVDHPIKQTQVLKEHISLGFLDHAKAYQRLHPEVSYEDAKRIVEENVIARGRVTRLMAEHGVTADAGHQLDNVNQQLGRLGGRPRSASDDEERQ